MQQRLLLAYRAHNVAHHDDLIRRVPGMVEAVGRLAAAGMKLAIVSSKITSMVERGLSACGLRQYFPVVVGVDQVAQHKPHPEPALAALAALGEAPGVDVAFIGDAPTDIECGHAAGCGACVAVAWTTFPRERVEAARPTHWAADAVQLVEVLLGERGPASMPEGGGESKC